MLPALKHLFVGSDTTPRTGISKELLMTTILHIDSSILGGYSVSRALSADIVARQLRLHPGSRVIRRDLVVDAALHLSDARAARLRARLSAKTLRSAGLISTISSPPTSS
jgi:FMN-dependent NADH-azoreductase